MNEWRKEGRNEGMKEWMNGLLQARDSEWQEGWLLEEVSSCWFVEIMWDSIMKSLESEAKLELIQKKKKSITEEFSKSVS